MPYGAKTSSPATARSFHVDHIRTFPDRVRDAAGSARGEDDVEVGRHGHGFQHPIAVLGLDQGQVAQEIVEMLPAEVAGAGEGEVHVLTRKVAGQTGGKKDSSFVARLGNLAPPAISKPRASPP